MTLQEIKAKGAQMTQGLRQVGAELRKEYAESKNIIAFTKTAFTREILEKKERIPGAIITGWFLVLLIACFDWTYGMNWAMVFNLGVLPFLVYYIVRNVWDSPRG